MPDVIALSLIADIVLAVQVEEAANRLGFRVATVSTPEKAIATLKQGRASLLILDTSAAEGRVAGVVQAAQNAPYPVAVLAFGPQADPNGLQAARAAGADVVVSSEAFGREMGPLLIACLDRHREAAARRGAKG